MRERYNYSTGKHPPTCTCAACQQSRAEAALPKVKKKQKPKSQRGKPKEKLESSSVLDEAMKLLNQPREKGDQYRKDDLDAR
jgi:hypothetical protein